MNFSIVEDSLPPVCRYSPHGWGEGLGSDYYGALQVAEAYCGIRRIRNVLPGIWQHGCVPPWQQVQPEMILSDAPRNARCWVGRKDEEEYLRTNGYQHVKAIGLPITYTSETGVQRIPGSLLVMPTHCIPLDDKASDFEEYVAATVDLAPKFDLVAACVSGRCVDTGLWVRHFEKRGIPVVRGATVDDSNSLSRMRMLFEMFEHVTTDRYGSHVAYALYLGAKVSIWGPSEALTREYLLRDTLWRRFPGAIDRLLTDESRSKSESLLGRLRVYPSNGVIDRELGEQMVGHGNRLHPEDLRRQFGWQFPFRAAKAAASRVKRSLAWRAARKVYRMGSRLLERPGKPTAGLARSIEEQTH